MWQDECWEIELRTRKGGKYKGDIDFYYRPRHSKQTLRSKPEVFAYLRQIRLADPASAAVPESLPAAGVQEPSGACCIHATPTDGMTDEPLQVQYLCILVPLPLCARQYIFSMHPGAIGALQHAPNSPRWNAR